ncbi:nuclear transport factor 2 family protein [Escherichia coli]|nr:nuclear transport factor 2 family protein [Escherichia coli]
MSEADRAAGAYAEVASALGDYFDGLYFSDTARLRRIFHPQAIYASATDGKLLYRTMDDYFPVVDARPSPASRNEARRDRIVAIEFAGPVTALAKLNCAIGEKYFTDLLTLVRLDGAWRIISKTFHHEPIA